MKLINKTSNGHLFYCGCGHIYQLEFGNLLFSLNENDYHSLKVHISEIDGESLLRNNNHLSLNRKILLNLPAKNTLFCLTQNELNELKRLLFVQNFIYSDCSLKLSGMNVSLN